MTASISTTSEASSTVTITTSAAHGFIVGQTVTILGVGVSGYNGVFTIATVPSSTTFTYTDSHTGLAGSSGGTATVSYQQTTAYVYGVGSTIGTDLFSNDLVAKMEYPDLTTGLASTSSSNDVSYKYNFRQQQATMTDQDGDVHAYTYDVLGRMTLDAVTTLGSGVDGTVRSIGYTFDTGGRPYQETQLFQCGWHDRR